MEGFSGQAAIARPAGQASQASKTSSPPSPILSFLSHDPRMIRIAQRLGWAAPVAFLESCFFQTLDRNDASCLVAWPPQHSRPFCCRALLPQLWMPCDGIPRDCNCCVSPTPLFWYLFETRRHSIGRRAVWAGYLSPTYRARAQAHDQQTKGRRDDSG
jgi:hypothetical protein